MGVGRRRTVLIEKLMPHKPKRRDITEMFQPLITPLFMSNVELFSKHRFYVELERADGIKIEDSRICGFKLDNNSGNKVLKVKTFLHIKEWLTDYEKVIIARISLLDSMGNEIKNLDFDVRFDGYSMECDYSSEGFIAPMFSYVIVES